MRFAEALAKLRTLARQTRDIPKRQRLNAIRKRTLERRNDARQERKRKNRAVRLAAARVKKRRKRKIAQASRRRNRSK